jgi:hypothetical protein
MPGTSRSSVHAGFALAAAGALVIASAALPTETRALPTVSSDVRLAAAASTSVTPPPGALITQFLANQLENCSLICPFIVQLAIEPATRFAIIPLTFAAELQAGQPLLKAIALTDATVSGAANAALTGIITNDLGLVLPRAQNALEVAVIGLIDIGTTGVTQPGNLLQAIDAARTNFLAGLQQPPGTMPPPAVHNALEAAAVRTIEVVSALTFQAPERLLLGITQAADAFFSTVGTTGDIGSGLAAAGASVATTVRESAAFVSHALTEPIPVAPTSTLSAAKPTTATTTTAIAAASTAPSSTAPVRTATTTTPTTKAADSGRRITKADNESPSLAVPELTHSVKPVDSTRTADQDLDGTVATHDDEATGPRHHDASEPAHEANPHSSPERAADDAKQPTG